MHDYYGPGAPKGGAGVVPAKDYNAPTPPHNTEDPVQKPDFLRESYEQLVEVRKELSRLYVEEMGARNKGYMSMKPGDRYSPDQLSVSAMERAADYKARIRKLEEREEALIAACATYKFVASLGDAPAEEDETGEAANTAESGATARVGRR